MGRFIEKGKTALVATASGGVGFTLAGLLLRDWNFSWDWSVAAQPLATLGAGIAAIIAAAIALHNGEKTREQDKEIHETSSRAEQERTLRERFTSIVELLATEDLTKRESGAYALAALADDWAAFYKDDQELSLKEQQVCLNILTRQLRDPISKDSPSELYTFKERIQDIIFIRFEEEDGKSPGQCSDLNLNLENCHFYNISSKGIFKNRASFANSHFHGRTSFTGAHFYSNTLFKGGHFCKHADFSRTHFNIKTPFNPNDYCRTYVDFSETNFHNSISFRKTIFHSRATFDGAHFNSNTPPQTATVFITDATFDLAHFYGTASFTYSHFHMYAQFQNVDFHESAWFENVHFENFTHFKDSNFNKQTSFKRANFKGYTNFENVHFADTADFSNTKFKFPESNESNKIIRLLNTNLDNAEFGIEFPTK